MKNMRRGAGSLLAAITLVLPTASEAQDKKKFVTNYDEAKVPKHTLPDPLALPGGGKITTVKEWEERGRPATLKLITEQMYGKMPVGKPKGFKVELENEVDDALGGKAIRREYVVSFAEGKGPRVRLLVYLPKDKVLNDEGSLPVPAFLGLNFRGNQTVEADPRITLNEGYVLGGKKEGDNKALAEKSRGTGAGRWPAELIVSQGYALATACCGNIDPDFDDGFKNGVHPLFTKGAPKPDEWGTISAWAWGLSRLLDAIEEIKEIDAQRVGVIGHSRLGKASLWAGATDERFRLVISNNSGCGGAALNKRAFGETVGRINRSFPHWFNGNFKNYNENEGALPFDQHQLIALIAPRSVYVASATGDRWADPKGEFLSLVNAEPVYSLYHDAPFGFTEQPKPGRCVGRVMGYHIREGKHNVTPEDWEHYLEFGDRWLKKQ
jgi:hypothetical protein